MWEQVKGVEARRFIDGKWVASKKEFAKICGVGLRTVERYLSAGMPTHPASLEKFIVIDVEQGLEFRNRNIKKSKANNVKVKEIAVDTVDDNIDDIVDDTIIPDYSKSEAKEKHFKAELAELKYLEEKGLLVKADDLDKAMAEQAVMHLTDKTNDEKVLPVMLEMKTSQEITTLLHEHNQDRLAMLDKIVNKEFKCNKTFYEVSEAVLQELKKGTKPDEVIKRIAKTSRKVTQSKVSKQISKKH